MADHENSKVQAVTEAIAFLMSHSELFEYESFELSEDELPEQVANLVESGKLTVSFFGDDESFELTVGDFLKLVSECSTLEQCENGLLRTSFSAIQKIAPTNEPSHKCVYQNEDLGLAQSNITFRITNRSFIAGFHAIQVGAFHEDFASPVSDHLVVEVTFHDAAIKRSELEDRALIESYLFELAASHNIVFTKQDFLGYGEPDWDFDQDFQYKLRPLEKGNDGMQLYLTAAAIEDPELKFLSMFKVLEWLSPTVANIGAADAMRKKLDNADALNPTGKFIREIFELAKEFDARRNDRDQIRAVLLEATDLVHLCQLLPVFLRRPLSHGSSFAEIEKVAKDVSECLCATRNQVAHAKSNYTARGTECPVDELPSLNDFLGNAAVQAIRWFNRLPEHRRTLPSLFSDS